MKIKCSRVVLPAKFCVHSPILVTIPPRGYCYLPIADGEKFRWITGWAELPCSHTAELRLAASLCHDAVSKNWEGS